VIEINFYYPEGFLILNEIREIELGFLQACSRGGRRATSIKRGSVLIDRPTQATIQQKAMYEVSRRQKILREINKS
jgi:hypothetical protein